MHVLFSVSRPHTVIRVYTFSFSLLFQTSKPRRSRRFLQHQQCNNVKWFSWERKLNAAHYIFPSRCIFFPSILAYFLCRCAIQTILCLRNEVVYNVNKRLFCLTNNIVETLERKTRWKKQIKRVLEWDQSDPTLALCLSSRNFWACGKIFQLARKIFLS